ncbi:hypothetical protein FSP39_022450 [Pinctada imbricata]|uniref:Uncharacterized protein n=1 Tax=Pinctada imbricata TaxID=66713 RepID=A0AA88YMK7_PINIB|nr:hypothetical protein FSP39_022450 [Pinctada imbricata]
MLYKNSIKNLYGNLYLFLFALLVAVSCFAELTKGQVTCEQVGPCKCNLTDGSGLIDLTWVAMNDNTPKWFDVRGADGYRYSYNPCVSFTEGPYCGDVAIYNLYKACKTANDSKTRWTIADPTTPTFHYDGNHAHILYTYNASGNYSILDVEYVCNFTSYDDTFIPLGETKPGSGIYNATVMTRCACPNVCVYPPRCSPVSLCSCNLTDWSGMIDISQYSKMDGLPAFPDVNGTDGYLYSYNPCHGFNQGACKNVVGCRTSPDMKIQEPLGDPNTAKFSYREDDNVHIVYTMSSDTDITRSGIYFIQFRTFDVALYCDYDADTPKFEAYNETKNGSNVFTAKLSSKCACKGECSSSPKPKCIQVNDCSCNMTDGTGVIDLSHISKQDGTATFTDILAPDGYYYSYNPCYGFTEGSCQNATGCLVDDTDSVQYTLGVPNSSRFYHDDVTVHVVYNHTDADNMVRYLDVSLVCDRSAEKSIFVPSGKPSQQSNYIVCKVTRNERAEYAVGLPGKFQFLFDGTNVHLVHNFATPSKFVYRFDVTFVCDKNAGNPSIVVDGESHPGSGNYCLSLRDFDISPIGFRITNTSVRAYFKRGTFRSSIDRSTDCDGEVNGVRLETWTYVTSFSTDYYDGCTISFPLSARPIKTVKIIVDSFFSDFEIKNETRWEFLFDMSRVSKSTKIMFGKACSYSIQRIKTLKNGNLKMKGIFKMKYKGARPLYSSFKFDGVNLIAPSPEKANVRINANGETTSDERVSMKDKVRGKYISSKLTIDESLVHSKGGTRGLMFFGATFQVTPYLKMTGSINIGFDIYTLSNGFYLFPYGSFAMLEPAKNNSVVTLKRNQYNIIPCLTIGASQFGFQYSPKLKKLNSDGSSSRSISRMNRKIIGLYYREFSPVVNGYLKDVEGTYKCELNYDVITHGRREERSIRRIFNVTVVN